MEPDRNFTVIHESPDLFREALAHTAAVTGFSQRLIEKDYFCTLVLRDFAPAFESGLVFKGGTSLSKVHAGFYRLSEDLDFVIPVDVHSPRSTRREKIEPIKRLFATVAERIPCLRVLTPFGAHNESKQYVGQLAYQSISTGHEQSVIVEVSLREPTLTPTIQRPAKTLLRSPENSRDAIVDAMVTVLSTAETYAEKFRAALTRIEPKIRDFYDLAYAIESGLIDPSDGLVRSLIASKLSVPGNSPVDMSQSKLDILTRQVETELKSVLRPADYERFNLASTFQLVTDVANRLRDGSF